MDYTDKKQIVLSTLALLIIFTGIFFFFKGEKTESPELENSGIATTTSGWVRNEITSEGVIDKILQGEDFVLLDVRTQEEYMRSHIVGAILFPVQALSEQSLVDFDLGDKNAEIVVYSNDNNRSAEAYALVTDWDYMKAKNLMGGLNKFETVARLSTSTNLIIRK